MWLLWWSKHSFLLRIWCPLLGFFFFLLGFLTRDFCISICVGFCSLILSQSICLCCFICCCCLLYSFKSSVSSHSNSSAFKLCRCIILWALLIIIVLLVVGPFIVTCVFLLISLAFIAILVTRSVVYIPDQVTINISFSKDCHLFTWTSLLWRLDTLRVWSLWFQSSNWLSVAARLSWFLRISPFFIQIIVICSCLHLLQCLLLRWIWLLVAVHFNLFGLLFFIKMTFNSLLFE